MFEIVFSLLYRDVTSMFTVRNASPVSGGGGIPVDAVGVSFEFFKLYLKLGLFMIFSDNIYEFCYSGPTLSASFFFSFFLFSSQLKQRSEQT